MKKKLPVLIVVPFAMFLIVATVAQSTNSVDVFVAVVNEAWQARDYPSILTNINHRLNSSSNDVLALALKLQYYTWAEVSLSNAQVAAISFLSVVTNVAPSELDDPSSLVKYAIAITAMDYPTNAPADESRTPSQVEFVHSTYPTSFPSIDQAVFLDSRIDPD